MPPDNLAQTLSSLLASEKYADLTINCGDRTFKVHRAIVCPQSEFFARAIEGPFREAFDSIINLPEDDLNDISRLVSYFYNADYDYDPPQNVTTSSRRPGIDTTAGGGKYILRSGTNSSKRRRLRSTPSQLPSTPQQQQEEQMIPEDPAVLKETTHRSQMTNIAMYALAEKLIVPDLKRLATQKFKAFGEPKSWAHKMGDLLRSAYTSVPVTYKAMKNQVVVVCAKYIPSDDSAEFNQVLVDFPEAHVDILQEHLSTKEALFVRLENNMATLPSLEQKKMWLDENNKLRVQNLLLVTQTRGLDTRVRQLRTENTGLAIENQRAEEEVKMATQKTELDAAKMRQLEIQVHQLETENARLATEKRKAEDTARESAEEVKEEKEWGHRKLKALVAKVNAAYCTTCRVRSENRYHHMHRSYFYHNRLSVEENENDYHNSEGPVVRCSSCRKLL